MIHTLREFARQMSEAGVKAEDFRYFEYIDEARKASRYYRQVSIEKNNGGLRRLHVPSRGLKKVQYEVFRYLEAAEISPCAFAYRKGVRLSDHVYCHTGAPLLVKLDIEDFFGSVKFPQVFWAIDKALSRSLLAGPSEKGGHAYNSELSWFFAKFCTISGFLPQGTPTSPMLSNLIFAPLDARIQAYCQTRGIRYTRYSDDLIFSGEFAPAALIKFVRRLLAENGFLLNEDKIVVARQGQRQKVTGVVVNERPQAEKAYRRKIRQEVYYIGKFGLESHLEAKGVLSKKAQDGQRLATAVKELQRLIGRIDFVLQIDSGNEEFKRYKEECVFLLNLLPSLWSGRLPEQPVKSL